MHSANVATTSLPPETESSSPVSLPSSTPNNVDNSTSVAGAIAALSDDLLSPQKLGQSELVATRQENDLLSLLAAYSGAAYTVTDSWNCAYACQYPGTEGTIVEYNWNIGFPPSAGYIASNPNTQLLVVAFQGTDDLAQWQDNFDIEKVSWPEGLSGSQVHRGFLRGYLDVREQMLNNLRRLAAQYPDYQIALVGHSLGGARATLALADLSIEMPDLLPRLGLYTQGQPRVGNRAFANAINVIKVPKSRQVYEYDIAPHVPFLALGYYHHLTELWIHDNQTTMCVNPTNNDGCSTEGDVGHPLNIDDHFGYPGLRYS
ncbi:hypothetical protein IW150_005543 [Coemansia sp. RSA 2607]|nr:hypothetical protein IW150_005543 [Coemansia sp. RSA 2607]